MDASQRDRMSLAPLGFIITIWYCLSILLVIFNNWLMVYYRFDFPIYLSFSHMLATAILSKMILSSYLYRRLRALDMWFTYVPATRAVDYGAIDIVDDDGDDGVSDDDDYDEPDDHHHHRADSDTSVRHRLDYLDGDDDNTTGGADGDVQDDQGAARGSACRPVALIARCTRCLRNIARTSNRAMRRSVGCLKRTLRASIGAVRRSPRLLDALHMLSLCILFVGDVTFGNMAFDYLKVSTIEIINSVTIILVFVGSLVIRIEDMDWRICIALVVMVIGSILSVRRDEGIDTRGMIYAILSMVMGALKVMLTATLLKPLGRTGALRLLSRFSPLAAAMLAVVMLFYERAGVTSQDHMFGYFSTLSIVSLNSFCAFLLNWSAFYIISSTSALTYEVLGTFKDIFTFVMAVVILGERLDAANVTGNILVLAGAMAYSVLRLTIMRRQMRRMVQLPRDDSLGNCVI